MPNKPNKVFDSLIKKLKEIEVKKNQDSIRR